MSCKGMCGVSSITPHVVSLTCPSSLLTDPTKITNSSANLTVNETDVVLLHCWAVGFPAPNISWSMVAFGSRNSTILAEVGTETSTEGGGSFLVRTQIRLSPVQLQDGGVYTCRVTNTVPTSGVSIGTASSTFSLTVQCKHEHSSMVFTEIKLCMQLLPWWFQLVSQLLLV